MLSHRPTKKIIHLCGTARVSAVTLHEFGKLRAQSHQLKAAEIFCSVFNTVLSEPTSSLSGHLGRRLLSLALCALLFTNSSWRIKEEKDQVKDCVAIISARNSSFLPTQILYGYFSFVTNNFAMMDWRHSTVLAKHVNCLQLWAMCCGPDALQKPLS